MASDTNTELGLHKTNKPENRLAKCQSYPVATLTVVGFNGIDPRIYPSLRSREDTDLAIEVDPLEVPLHHEQVFPFWVRSVISVLQFRAQLDVSKRTISSYTNYPQTCHSLFGVGSVRLVVSLVVASLCGDAVLYLRLYALSKQARIVKIVLMTNYTVVSVICITGITLFFCSETCEYFSALLFTTSALKLGASRPVSQFTAHDTLFSLGNKINNPLAHFTTALSLWYGVKLYLTTQPMSPSTLIKIFHRDGAVYFVCISTISLVNASIGLFAPHARNGSQRASNTDDPTFTRGGTYYLPANKCSTSTRVFQYLGAILHVKVAS
ncbi:hypothetical protein BKA70DRAFT_1223966 [Coprinopsis sp. MPI-PUGE-AT-0042]|nr:hypothetical protein BKA70DRAFT_1223966 [Coprinopsis sp. MPI-PUGE-AT-0042]